MTSTSFGTGDYQYPSVDRQRPAICANVVVMPTSPPFFFFLGTLAWLFPDTALTILGTLVAIRLLMSHS